MSRIWYGKMYKEKIFEVKTRRIIYKLIAQNPGLHFRELARSLKMPGSTLSYHLKYLEKRGFLSKEFENGYTRYFTSEKIGKADKKLFNILREPVPRNIILYLCLFPNPSQTDMIKFAKKWKKHPSKIGYYLNKHHTTLGFHLKKLTEEGIIESFIEGNNVKYRLYSPEDIFDLIIRYENSILADAFGRFLEYFDDDKYWTPGMNASLDKIYDVFPHPYHV